MGESNVDTVKIKAATAELGDDTGDFVNDAVLLHLITDEGVKIDFELGLMATAILSLTLHPILQGLQARAKAQGEPL